MTGAATARLRLAPFVLAVAAVLAGCGSGGAGSPRTRAELVNFQLGPEYSHWLVGPIAVMASPEEIERYLAVTGDFAALDVIEAFWARRDPDPAERGNPVREEFERRAEEADRRYDEAGIRGRRTARGTLFVLHGAPESIEFDSAPDGGPPIEVWKYPADAPTGLHGRPPERFYWFRQQGDLTLPYQPRVQPVRSIGG